MPCLFSGPRGAPTLMVCLSVVCSPPSSYRTLSAISKEQWDKIGNIKKLPHEDEDQEKEHPISQSVSFGQRSYPLLDMLRQANNSGVPVMWEPADSSW